MTAHSRVTEPEPDGKTPLRILLVEDNPGDARLLREMLSELSTRDYQLRQVGRLDDGLAHLEAEPVDLVLLDLTLPDSRGFETFEHVHDAAARVPIIVLSGLADGDLAVRAVHGGAQDYLVKGQVDSFALARAIRYAVERKQVELERADLEREKGQFFSNISHDLRTPLAAIKASVGVLLANTTDDSPAALVRMLTNIDRSADEMTHLVNDLLELTRLQAGRVELWCAESDLREIARRAAQSIQVLADQRQQRLEVDLPPGPLLATVDAERFTRVLLNLLANAQKYGRDGGLIRLSLRAVDDQGEFTVEDDGPGISAAELPHIFERYYRASGEAAHTRRGTGLGLPIARALTELHGGELVVESTVGVGSTFRVRLPLANSEGALASGSAAASSPPQ